MTREELASAPPAVVMAHLRLLRALADHVEPAPHEIAGADLPADLDGFIPECVLDAYGDFRPDWRTRAAEWALGPGARSSEVAALARDAL